MLKVYVTGHLRTDFFELHEKCFTSLEEAQRSFHPDGKARWIQTGPRMWITEGVLPRAAVMEVWLQGFSPAAESEEGVLRHDFDEGWILDGDGPHKGVRICDLFPELDGKRVRVRIEVLEDNPVKKE